MLVVGILIGVGISGPVIVSDAERTRLSVSFGTCCAQLDASKRGCSTLSNAARRLPEDFVKGAYPALVDTASAESGSHWLVLGLGRSDRVGFVERALDD